MVNQSTVEMLRCVQNNIDESISSIKNVLGTDNLILLNIASDFFFLFALSAIKRLKLCE